MAGTLHERYKDISVISGLSEEIVKRVLKATRQSLVKTLENGEKATLTGIVTLIPEVKSRLNSNEYKLKIKAKPSISLETDIAKNNGFKRGGTKEEKEEASNKAGINALNFIDNNKVSELGIVTKQLNSLL